MLRNARRQNRNLKCRLATACLAILIPSAFPPLPCPAQGVITTVAGTDWLFPSGNRPAVNAPLGLVVGVAVDSTGNLYLTDVGNRMVFKASADGTLTILAGNGIQWFSGERGQATGASLSQPNGLAVDGAGNLYIADEENHRIRKITTSGIITTIAGTGQKGFSGDGALATSAQLEQPAGVAVIGPH